MSETNWKSYWIEFISVFVAVISAFALNNWNENRRDHQAEIKILTEISNGLKNDLYDIDTNIGGHKEGIAACKFWRQLITNQPVNMDSLTIYYLSLTRDFVVVQNKSGYENLKSRGLELVEDDSLRYQIISLYEYDYTILKKLEEEYSEMQFHSTYYPTINTLISPFFRYDVNGNLIGLDTSIRLSDKDQSLLLSYLFKIQINRNYVLYYYNAVRDKVNLLDERIEKEL